MTISETRGKRVVIHMLGGETFIGIVGYVGPASISLKDSPQLPSRIILLHAVASIEVDAGPRQ